MNGAKQLRVLVGCEFSGTVRDAFIRRGHDAMSCDLLPTEAPGPHYCGDIFDVVGDGWDLAIFHPPCTFLTVSCNKWFKDGIKARPGTLTGHERREARDLALDFVRRLWDCGIPRICIENPIGRLSTLWREPSQVVQPWMFGCGEKKGTCFWLKGLPLLQPTHRKNDLFCKPEPVERLDRIFRLPPGPDRAKERSKTYPGISSAMAEQWG